MPNLKIGALLDLVLWAKQYSLVFLQTNLFPWQPKMADFENISFHMMCLDEVHPHAKFQEDPLSSF